MKEKLTLVPVLDLEAWAGIGCIVIFWPILLIILPFILYGMSLDFYQTSREIEFATIFYGAVPFIINAAIGIALPNALINKTESKEGLTTEYTYKEENLIGVWIILIVYLTILALIIGYGSNEAYRMTPTYPWIKWFTLYPILITAFLTALVKAIIMSNDKYVSTKAMIVNSSFYLLTLVMLLIIMLIGRGIDTKYNVKAAIAIQEKSEYLNQIDNLEDELKYLKKSLEREYQESNENHSALYKFFKDEWKKNNPNNQDKYYYETNSRASDHYANRKVSEVYSKSK